MARLGTCGRCDDYTRVFSEGLCSSCVHDAEVQNLRAEVKRLREALTMVRNTGASHAATGMVVIPVTTYQRARAALNPGEGERDWVCDYCGVRYPERVAGCCDKARAALNLTKAEP